ncbi:cation:proton antiporter [Sphingomonas jeddahensis]|uniref:Sodium/hydrogen exchanger family protein n=1 Tax=Sphingomonas jeddahensis TaxID=1915074 RepID=A0A1V2ERX4_9SPHN|nr:cation:proton antiporter [Sphingomonas jeddahensis]ONF95431.1 Sodium/hydrogen exchanger family protein [Sphingomonas jeddahensis]
MRTTELFLIAMLIVFSAPYLFWRLLRTDHYAPLVIVQIIAGVLLGPGVLGAAFPQWHASVFNPQVIGALSGIAWWAVMIFVFVAGVELDIGEAWARRRETSITAACALLVPLAFGCLAAILLLAWRSEWAGVDGARWQVVLGIGMACAVTALPILVLLLQKLGILRKPLGQRILRYASLDDIAIWGVLALILLDWERVGRQVGFFVVFPVAAIVFRMLLRRLPEADRWYVALIWLAACGLAADWAGLHYMVGAFLAGAILDARWFDQVRMDMFRHNLLLAVMPVYFLSTGLRTNWSGGGAAVIGAAVILLVASVAGKLAGVHLAGRLLRWPKGDASLIGWLLQTKALIMIIFANILLDKAIISAATFTALLLMAVMSTMLTIPVVAPRLRRMGFRPHVD